MLKQAQRISESSILETNIAKQSHSRECTCFWVAVSPAFRTLKLLAQTHRLNTKGDQKRVFLDVSDDALMSLCVAGVALGDIRCVSGGMCVHNRREGKVGVSMGEATKTCISRRVRRCAHVVLHGRRGTL